MNTQVDALTEDNRVRSSDVWFALKDFSLALATLQTGLEHYLKAVVADPGSDSESSDEEEDGEDGGESETETDSTEAEAETADETEAGQFEAGATRIIPLKPQTITEGDWKVYRAIVQTRREFDVKFKAMWS